MLPPKRLTIVPYIFKRIINYIHKICPHHGNLIDDKQLQFLKQFPFVFSISQMASKTGWIVCQIVINRVIDRYKCNQRKSKSRMNRSSTGMDRGYSGGRSEEHTSELQSR